MIIKFIFPSILRGKKPKNIFFLLYYIVDALAFIWFIVWFIYLLWPHQWYQYQIGNMQVYTQVTIIEERLRGKFTVAQSILSKNNISLENNITVKFYASDFEYFFRMFPGSQIFSLLFSNPGADTIGHTISIRNFNNQDMTVGENHMLPFESLIAHEIVHIWQYEKYGAISMYIPGLIDRWIKEGFATYKADQIILLQKEFQSLFSIAAIKDFLIEYQKRNSSKITPADYYLWALMVKHAIEDMHISVDDLHHGKVSYDEVLKSLLSKYGIEQETKSKK